MTTARRSWVRSAAVSLAGALLVTSGPAGAAPTEAGARAEAALAPRASTPAPLGTAPFELLVPKVAYEPWRGLAAGCSYLAPRDAGAAPDGSIDVVFHFHAGQMVEREMKESGGGTVFVSCGYGFGSGPYADAFADPERFGRMMKTLVSSLERSSGVRGLAIRHLGLASFSAGFAAIGRILAVDRYYAMVDSVVLNDSLHAGYTAGSKGVEKRPSQGVARVDLKMLRGFVRFARDAAAGTKTMVMTHSAIVPPDYASSTEATRALLAAVDVPTVELTEASSAGAATGARAMTPSYRADRGDLHVVGFRGRGPRDHFDHLHLLADALRTWIVPRWRQRASAPVGRTAARR